MYADITFPSGKEITTEKDGVVIPLIIDTKVGGATVDTTGYTRDMITAGHLVLVNGEGEYKLMPVNEETKAYGSKPSGYSYAGVVVATTRTKEPFVGILTRGRVNYKAADYKMDSILSAVKSALPLIEFRAD